MIDRKLPHAKLSNVACALLFRIASSPGGLEDWRTGETVQANRFGFLRVSDRRLVLTSQGEEWVREERARLDASRARKSVRRSE